MAGQNRRDGQLRFGTINYGTVTSSPGSEVLLSYI